MSEWVNEWMNWITSCSIEVKKLSPRLKWTVILPHFLPQPWTCSRPSLAACPPLSPYWYHGNYTWGYMWVCPFFVFISFLCFLCFFSLSFLISLYLNEWPDEWMNAALLTVKKFSSRLKWTTELGIIAAKTGPLPRTTSTGNKFYNSTNVQRGLWYIFGNKKNDRFFRF